MHTPEPFSGWLKDYDSSADGRSPFFEKEYNLDIYSGTIYGYYIDPAWDSFGSETPYLEMLFADYGRGDVIVELRGEWNDAINNDVMTLKRGFVDLLLQEGTRKFILLGPTC